MKDVNNSYKCIVISKGDTHKSVAVTKISPSVGCFEKRTPIESLCTFLHVCLYMNWLKHNTYHKECPNNSQVYYFSLFAVWNTQNLDSWTFFIVGFLVFLKEENKCSGLHAQKLIGSAAGSFWHPATPTEHWARTEINHFWRLTQQYARAREENKKRNSGSHN